MFRVTSLRTKKRNPNGVVPKLQKSVGFFFFFVHVRRISVRIVVIFFVVIAPKENDLFGEADDISSDEDQPKTPRPMSDDEVDQDKSDNDDKRSGGDGGGDDDDDDNDDDEKADDEEKEKEAEEPIPERRIAVEIPKISVDLGSDLHFVKLPNFLSVETRPYDRETYEDEIDEEETLDEEGRARYANKNANVTICFLINIFYLTILG